MGRHEKFKGRGGWLVARDQAGQPTADLLEGCDEGLDLAARKELDLMDGGPVQGVDHRNGQDIGIKAQGQDFQLAQKGRINCPQSPVVNLGKDVFGGDAKMGPVGDEGCQFFLAQQAEGQNSLGKPRSSAARGVVDCLAVLFREQALGDEEVPQFCRHCGLLYPGRLKNKYLALFYATTASKMGALYGARTCQEPLPLEHDKMSELKKSEIKGPDALQVRIFSTLNWLMLNKKQMGLVLLPVVLVAAGGFVWQAVTNKMKDTRLKALAKIEDQFGAETEQAYKKANPAGQPGAQPDAKVQPDHGASLLKYAEFAKENPGNAEGWLAGLRATNISLDKEQLAQGDLEAALKLVEAVIAKSTASPFHQTAGRLMAMAILEDLKRFDDALKQSATLMGTVNDDLKPRILLGKARIELAKNAKDDAKATLNVIIEKHGTSDEAAKARALMATI